MDKTQTMNVAYDRVSLLLLFSACQVYVPMTMRSWKSLTPKEYLCVSIVTRLLGDYKDALQLSPKVSVKLAWIKTGICYSVWRRGISRPTRQYNITISLARKVTKVLAMGSCITEQVKRLASNEIELGMEIPMIESWASNIDWILDIVVQPINIFIECRNQYGHPGPAIGYWPERSLGHVCIFLNP